MSKFLCVDEAASLLRVKPQTIYKWICEDRIPSIAINGRTLFDEEELHAWIDSKKRCPRSSVKQKSLASLKKKSLPGGEL